MSDLVVGALDPARWDERIALFPDATVFHTRAWLDLLARQHASKPLLVEVRDGSESVALWPVLETWKGPLRILGSPLPATSTPYLGPLFSERVSHQIVMHAMLGNEAFGPAAYFACRVLDERLDVDLEPFRFRPVRRFETYRIDLRESEESLWRNLRGECRNRVRRARKLGLEVRVEESLEFLDEFWSMSLETYARTGSRPTYDRAFVADLWASLGCSGRLLVLSALQRGERLATLILPHDDHTVYYWGGASRQAFRRIPSNNLLHWEAILAGHRMGLSRYDLISTEGSFGRFKLSFGPRPVVTATHWERSSSWWVAILKQQYERYQRHRLGTAA